jgi:hypothetical protein
MFDKIPTLEQQKSVLRLKKALKINKKTTQNSNKLLTNKKLKTKIHIKMDCTTLYNSLIVKMITIGITDFLGIVLNLFNVVCFVQIVVKVENTNMFKYLLVKSASEFAIFIIDVFFIRYYCVACSMANTLAGEIWNNYFSSFIEICLFYVSSIMEIAVTLDCYLTIITASRFKFLLSKTSFYVIVSGSVLFSTIFHVYFLLGYSVVSVKVSLQTIANVTSEYEKFYTVKTTFGQTDTFKVFSLIHSILRDVVMLFVILLLNVLVLKELKAFTKRRMFLTGDVGATSYGEHTAVTLTTTGPVNQSVLVAQRAETRKCVMILLTGLMFGLGHIGQAVANFQSKFAYNASYDAWFCVYFVAIRLFNLSYAVNFFLYYFFNAQFKKYANETIAFIVYPVKGFLDKSKATN